MDGCPTLERIAANNPAALENLKQLRTPVQTEDEAAQTTAGAALLGILQAIARHMRTITKSAKEAYPDEGRVSGI